MKQIANIFFAILFMSSCTSNTIYKKPENLIPRDKMVDILADMQLALGAKSIKNLDGNKNVEYMPLVYKKYGIDSVQFAESNFYYTSNIDEFNKVLRKTQQKLNKIKKQYETERNTLDSIADSKKKSLKEIEKVDPRLNKKEVERVEN